MAINTIAYLITIYQWVRNLRAGVQCDAVHYHWNAPRHRCTRGKGHPGPHRSVFQWK